MATMHVLPRPTPAERPDRDVEIQVDERLEEFAETIEEWVTPRQAWEFTLHEGHDFGRANNVEGRILVLLFEEHDGIAKLARLTGTASTLSSSTS